MTKNLNRKHNNIVIKIICKLQKKQFFSNIYKKYLSRWIGSN